MLSHYWVLLRGTQFTYTKTIEGVYFKQMNLILCKLCLSKVIYKEHSSCDCQDVQLSRIRKAYSYSKNFHQLPRSSRGKTSVQFLSLEAYVSVLTFSQ